MPAQNIYRTMLMALVLTAGATGAAQIPFIMPSRVAVRISTELIRRDPFSIFKRKRNQNRTTDGVINTGNTGGASEKLGRTDWFNAEIVRKLTFTGQRTFGYQKYSVEGDRAAFSSLTNYGTGERQFTDIGSLRIAGNRVAGLLDFQAEFTDNRFQDPEKQQYLLSYRKKEFDINYGTVLASLQSQNRFVNFSRSLDGFTGRYSNGRFQLNALRSSARGAARTITIEGNNTAGPYYLQSGRIIPDTLRLNLDGEELKIGRDFLLENSLGTVTLLNKIVPPTSTLVASYESYDFGQQRGNLTGVDAQYNLGGLGRIGITQIKQEVGSSTPSQPRIEELLGSGQPAQAIILQFNPIVGSVSITVDGRPATLGVLSDGVSEFYNDPQLPALIFSRFAIPPSQRIQVRYTPRIEQSVTSDRTVTGFAWQLPLSKDLRNRLTVSHSSGKSPTSSGLAQAMDLTFGEGKGQFRAGLRKIDSGYQSIEQAGFNRNEEAVQYSYDYASKGYRLNLDTQNSLVSFQDTRSATPQLAFARLIINRATLSRGAAEFVPNKVQKIQNLSLHQNRSVATDDNRLSTLSFNEQQISSKLRFSYGVSDTTGRGRVGTSIQDVSVRSLRTGATLTPNDTYSATLNIARSRVAVGSTNSEGMDYTLSGTLNQVGPWQASLSYGLSDSGALASLGGLVNAGSIGYGGNGFSGLDSLTTISTGATRANRLSYGVNHRASSRLLLDLNYSNVTSQGYSTSNTSANSLGLGVQWQLDDRNSVYLSYSRAATNFFGAGTGTNSSASLTAFAGGQLGNKWTYSIGANSLTSSGAGFEQSALSADFQLGYFLRPGHRVFYDLAYNKTKGSFGQNDFASSAGYSYSVGTGINLVGRYSFRDLRNLTSTTGTGSFRSNGFTIELSFDFGGLRK